MLPSYNKVWTTAGELTYSEALCYAPLRGCPPEDLINGRVKNLSLRWVRIRINDNCTGRTLHFDKQGNISLRINVLLKSFTDPHFWSRAPVTVPSQSTFCLLMACAGISSCIFSGGKKLHLLRMQCCITANTAFYRHSLRFEVTVTTPNITMSRE